MKRTLAMLCALVMALAVLPAVSFAAEFPDHAPVNFYVTDLDWTDVQPGSTLSTAQKFQYFGITEGSGMFAMGYLINYLPDYFAPTAYSVTWSGGLTAQISQTWDDEEEYSDKINVVANINYAGQSGGSPKGETGKMYVNGGMYLGSGQYGGCQMGGYLVRLAMGYVAQPAKEDCLYEAGVGYYLPVALTIYEFEYMVYDENHSPKSSDKCVELIEDTEADYEYAPWLTATDGKILIYADDGGPEETEPPVTEPPVITVTETFYLNGEFFAEVTHDEGAEWEMPAYTPDEGYTFSGWTETSEHVWNGTTSQIMYTLTIVYQYQDGDVIDTVEYTLPYGTAYSYDSPEIEGYTAYPAVVEGTLTDNDTVHVNYAAIPYYHFIIHFVDAYNMNDELAPAIEGEYPANYELTFEYPVIEGYTYEQQGQTGSQIITGDGELYAKYVPNTYVLTIIYQYADGSEAAEAYTGEYLYKRDYSVESPVIEGYTADYPVVNGQMCIDGETIYVTYTANEYTITVHLVDENGEPVGEDIVVTVSYGDDYTIALPEIDGYDPVDPVTGKCDGDAEFTVTYTESYIPVPPTVEGTKADLRARATEDAYRDLRFIYTVTFNDSYINYKGSNYGPTEEYYQITKYWSTLATATNSITVKGTTIYTMYEDAEGEENTGVFTFAAVLKAVKEANFDIEVTATPYINYTYAGVTEEYVGDPVAASVNTAAN